MGAQPLAMGLPGLLIPSWDLVTPNEALLFACERAGHNPAVTMRRRRRRRRRMMRMRMRIRMMMMTTTTSPPGPTDTPSSAPSAGGSRQSAHLGPAIGPGGELTPALACVRSTQASAWRF
jgi:hypothetical protein